MADDAGIRIGLLTDVHYGQDERERLVAGLEHAVARFNEHEVHAVVHLGDLIEVEGGQQDCLEAVARARSLIRDELDAAYHEVPGNHDVETLGPTQFVGDDCTFPCTLAFTDGVTGVFLDTTLPEWPHVAGALGEAQVDALSSILAEADAAVIFSHHPLHAHDQTGGWFEGYPELAYPRDRYWAHEQIQEAGNVRGLVNGHTHLETIHAFEGIPSFTVGAFNRERPGREAVTGSFAIMETSADHVGYHSFKDGSSHGTTTFS